MTDSPDNNEALKQARKTLENLEDPKRPYSLQEIVGAARTIFVNLRNAGLSLEDLDPNGISTDGEVIGRIQRAAIGAFLWDIHQMIVALESGTSDVPGAAKKIRQALDEKVKHMHSMVASGAEDVLGPPRNGPLTNMQQAIEARIAEAVTQAHILQINRGLKAIGNYSGIYLEPCETKILEIEAAFSAIDRSPIALSVGNKKSVGDLKIEFAQVRFDLYCRIIDKNIKELNDPNKLFNVGYMENSLPWTIRRLATQARNVISQLPTTEQESATNNIQKLEQSLNPAIIEKCLVTADEKLSTLEVRDLKGINNTQLLTWSAIQEEVTKIRGYAELAQRLNGDSTNNTNNTNNEYSTSFHARIQGIKNRIDPATVTASLTNLQPSALAIKFNDQSCPLKTVPVCVLVAITKIHREFYLAADDLRKVNASEIADALSKTTELGYTELSYWYQEKFGELERLAKMAAAAQARIATARAPAPDGGS